MTARKSLPQNVPGDFYVEAGCCTMCGVPFAEAPELFGEFQSEGQRYSQCFVRRQPETAAEIDHMVRTIQCAELQCIRYSGTDRAIQLRLVACGQGAVCDNLPPDLQVEHDSRQVLLAKHRIKNRDTGRQQDSERPSWLRRIAVRLKWPW